MKDFIWILAVAAVYMLGRPVMKRLDEFFLGEGCADAGKDSREASSEHISKENPD